MGDMKMTDDFNKEEYEDVIGFEDIPEAPDDYMEMGASKSLAQAAFILGLIGMIFSPIPCLTLLSIPLGIAAIIMGAIAAKDEFVKKKATLGIVFGSIGFVACLLFMFISWALQFVQEVL